MKKTIAIIASVDTKQEELLYLRDVIEKRGFRVLIIDISTRGEYSLIPDVTRMEVLSSAGVKWDAFCLLPKHEMISIMTAGITVKLQQLYENSFFDAVLSIGGLQNTTMAVSAMKKLPVGVPKVMVSTVASGLRTFDTIVGTKDILCMPSITDLAGINPITATILENSAAAVMGMAQYAGKSLSVENELLVSATLMGATNDGCVQAIRFVRDAGYRVVSFHSTGTGGRAMEEFIRDGTIKAVMDLSMHEIVSEHLGGFSAGADNRLIAAKEKGIPVVAVPGGIDFVDYYAKDFFSDVVLGAHEKRKYMLHNSEIAHIKLLPDEAVIIAKTIADRLNRCRGPVTMLFPLKGLRHNTLPGEPLYDPDVDSAIVSVFREKLNAGIRYLEYDLHFNDIDFSRHVADEMTRLLGKKSSKGGEYVF